MDKGTLLKLKEKGEAILIRFFALTNGNISHWITFGEAVDEWGWTDEECGQVKDYLVSKSFIKRETRGDIRTGLFSLTELGLDHAEHLILSNTTESNKSIGDRTDQQPTSINFSNINVGGNFTANLFDVAGGNQTTTTTTTTITQQGSSSTAAATSQPPITNKVELSKLIRRHYDLGEFKSLCFELQVEYDDLPGETLTNRVEALVEYLERRGRVQELLKLIKQQRPNAT